MDKMVHYLELKNSFIGFLTLSMAAIFAILLWKERDKWEKPFWGAAAGLAIFSLGMSLHQGWYWSWRHFGHQSNAWAFENFEWLAFFVFMIILGAACTIRNFTAYNYGHSAWVSIVTAAAFGAVFAWYAPI